jgi:hypothetical protein
MMTPVASASSSGFVLAIVGVILLVALVELRRFRQESVVLYGWRSLTARGAAHRTGNACYLNIAFKRCNTNIAL